jgi:cation:H+ antiporter
MGITFLIILFLISSAVIWYAGVYLAKATDTIDTRFNLGDALGGLILLGIAGSLPEIAVVVSAALKGNYDVIIGNLIGGISIQTLVIIIFDAIVKGKKPLSYLAGSAMLALEGLFAIVIIAMTIVGAKLPANVHFAGISPISILIVLAWILGLFLIDKVRQIKAFNTVLPDADPGRRHKERRAVENHVFFKGRSNSFVFLIFGLGALATLIAGVVLERTGNSIATTFGISSGIFAATFMGLATSLPEISTGVESILIGDNQLSISDIFGGNAFMPVIFILADILSKKPVMTFSTGQDIGFAILGILLTAIYSIAYIFKPQRRFLRLGIDSILVLIFYILGLALIFTH